MKGLRLFALLLILSSALYAGAYGSFGVMGEAEFTSIDDIPEYSYGMTVEARGGADIMDSLSLYGALNLGFKMPLYPLHRFLALPCVFSVGIGAGAVYRIGRWSVSGDIGIRSYIASGQQTLMYGGTIRAGYTFLTGHDFRRTNRDVLPIGYTVSVPVTAYISPSGLDIAFGVMLSIDIASDWMRRAA